MGKYYIIFCFLQSDGRVETDECGCEIYHRDEVIAEDMEQAQKIFLEQFKEVKPEIVEIVEE